MLSVNKLISFNKKDICFDKSSIKEILSKCDYPLNIISFIGEARFGKSTLINCFLTYLSNINTTVFSTSNKNEHCTKGIDYWLYKKESDKYGYLLLDCQGINHGDSSNDYKILLLAYEISNIIVYTDKKINNGTLKGLEAMNLFEKHMPNIYNKKYKPNLIFRIRDYDLDEKIENTLKDLMVEHEDQYNALRLTINKLFKQVNAISTEPLNKNERNILNEKNYKLILALKDNGFEHMCEYISNISRESIYQNYNELFINNIESIINKLIDDKINYKIFDIVSLNLKKDLETFMENINSHIFEETSENLYLDKTYNTEMTKLINLQSTIDNFNVTFEKSDNTITYPYLELLLSRKKELTNKIDEIKNSTYGKCLKKIKKILNKNKELINTYTCNYELFNNQHLKIVNVIMHEFEKSIQNYTTCVKNEIIEKINKQLTNDLEKIYKIYYQNINEYINFWITKNDEFLNNVLVYENIKNLNIYKRYEEQQFIKDLYDTWNNYFTIVPKIYEKYVRIDFVVIDEIKFTCSYFQKDNDISRFSNNTYYLEKIKLYIMSDNVKKNYIEKMKDLLANCIIKSEHYINIINLHPDILFFKINCNKLQEILNIDKDTLIVDTQLKFIIKEKIEIVDKRFNFDNIIKNFKVNEYNNCIFLNFDKNDIRKKYIIKKIINYHGNKMLDDMNI